MKHCLLFASLISPSKMILFEKKYQTFDTVFHHQMKHLEVRQKYSAARRIFNSLLGVSSGDETLHLMFDILLEKFGGSFLFQCNYDLKFLDLEGLPLFYRNILTVWQIVHSKVPLSVNEIKEEILWNNRFIKMGGKTVFL